MALSPRTTGTAEAVLCIDISSGKLVPGSRDLHYLPGCESNETLDKPWWELLGCRAYQHHPVTAALATGGRTPLPAFCIQTGGQGTVVTGEVYPLPDTNDTRAAICLYPLVDERDIESLEPLSVGDTIGVLGISGLSHDDQLEPSRHQSLITGIYRETRALLRAQDSIIPAPGSGFIFVLRQVEIEQATLIGKALGSQASAVLHTDTADNSANRAAIGLAAITTTPLVALVQANNALLRALSDTDSTLLCVTGPGDARYATARAQEMRGIFTARNHVIQVPDAPADITVNPLETGIQGYVGDNMEGAVDQALFLAPLDTLIAVVGPRGTGKSYIARMIHESWSDNPDNLVAINCRELGSRNTANRRLDKALRQSANKTLVLKSPHLLHLDVQQRLARQLATRTLADTSPRRYLPRAKYIALFPLPVERLVASKELSPRLASVFASYPVTVPPLRNRRQGILRWAHKILVQESSQRDRIMKGFTPDAERALMAYNWPGNISEMRACIVHALEHSDKRWLTPVDLELFAGIAEQTPGTNAPADNGILSNVINEHRNEPELYSPSVLEQLDLALATAVNELSKQRVSKPLGTWLEDELVMATLGRFQGDNPRTAKFLHTRSRNISRRLEKIQLRAAERDNSALWQQPARLIEVWVAELSLQEQSPVERCWHMLLTHVQSQFTQSSIAQHAAIMGVSAPTLKKRLETIDD